MSARDAHRHAEPMPVESATPARDSAEPASAVHASAAAVEAASGSTRSPSGGLISAILSRAQTADEGALAALRTLPRRAAPDRDFTDPMATDQRVRERIALLQELALDKPAAQQARLLTQAAELLAQLGETARAQACYVEALTSDPQQRLAAQQLLRSYLRQGAWTDAVQLLETMCLVNADPRERSLALCARAELAERLGAPALEVIALLERARLEQPTSLVASMLLARQLLRAGAPLELAQALRHAAQRADRASTRALLSLEAGRTLERHGQPNEAQSCYAHAHAEDPSSLGALLGIARLQLGRSDRKGASMTLAHLSALEQQPELHAEWTRQRGLLLLDGLEEAAQALTVLQSQRSVSGLRALARAAEAAGDAAVEERAQSSLAQLSGGALRSLIAAERASAQRRAQGLGPAPSPASADAAVSNAAGPGEALRKAAQLCTDKAAASDEHRLLLEVRPEHAAFLDADIVGVDLAAELAELPALRAALQRDAARWPERMRAGPLIALLDLEGVDHARPEQNALWHALSQHAGGQPVVTRYLAARAPSPEHSARLWLSEALGASGSQAAFAATSAGHCLEMAGLDATEAYVDALDAQRGYLPAAFGLEIRARAHAELNALERVHREIADTCGCAQEQSARYVRLGLLNADTDLSAAAHWLGLAAEQAEADAILDELSIRLAMDQSPAHKAELLESAAERQLSSAYARAMRLQAAEAHETAGQWDDAIRLYRQQLAEAPSDLFTDCALLSCLRRRGRPAGLAAELEQRVRECVEPERRAVLLMEWAQSELAQGQAQRAQAILEQAVAESTGRIPVCVLRARQRMALLRENDAEIMLTAQQLSEALEERQSSAAELRLCVRMCRRLGVDLYTPLMAAEGRLREGWYARELEALALRGDDRMRLYEAMNLQAELACREPSPLERAAYALRAAEVLEGTAPERAARELADALSAAREHPLALERLAHLYKAAGDTLHAAHGFARAAQFSASSQRAAALHYTAAVLFQDELDEPAHAIANLQRTAQVDLLFADTFARLQLLLKRYGDRDQLLDLLRARLGLSAEPQLVAAVQLERQRLLLSDPAPSAQAEARRALDAALAADPECREALAALAELQERAGEHRQAASTWSQLIRLLDEPKPLAEAYLRLGSLYQDRLDDPHSAEHALKRALEQIPAHADALDRLARLYRDQGHLAAALEAVDALLALDALGAERERWVIEQAQLRDLLGDHRGAIEALELAERLDPTNLPFVRAHAELLERAGAQDARQALWQRSCHALRTAIEMDPGQLTHWLGLHELLCARGASDAAAVVAHAAHSLGLRHTELPITTPRGLGMQALMPAVLARFAPRGPLPAIANLLQALGPVLAPHLPFEHPCESILASVAQAVAPAVTGQLGLGDLRISRCEANVCVPLSASPLHVCLGSAWFDRASDAERTFALLRAIVLAKLDLSLLARCAPERFGLVLNALWSVADRTHLVVVLDATEHNRVAAQLAQSLGESERARLPQLIGAVIEHDDINPRRLQSTAFDYAARIALCVTADLWSGLSGQLLMRGKSAGALDPRERIELCRTDSALRDLLTFAISESYAQARSQVLGTPPRETR